MTNSIKSIKFVGSLVEMNKDTDVISEDVVSMGQEGIMYFVNEALDRADNETIYVVGDDEVMNENIATVLNQKYNEEMTLIMEAKQIVNNTIEATQSITAKIEEETTMTNEDKILGSSRAQAFLKQHGAAMVNAKKAPAKKEETTTNTKEEKEMTQTTKGARRRLSTTKVTTEVTAKAVSNKTTKTNEEVKEMNNTTKGNTRRRLSTTVTSTAGVQTKRTGAAKRRLARSASVTNTFVKFEGPWYLNAELYPVLNRFESILENMSDSELGIEQIVLVDPADMKRYENRTDLEVIIQVKSNGTVLDFPIKEASKNSNADFASSSIGWVETKNGLRPAFGFWRPNAMNVEVTCSCGNKFKGNTGNVYCAKCRTRHDDIEVSASHALDFKFDGEWTFQTIPNVTVPRDVLALVLAVAQYDAGYDMHGVVAEDAE